MVIGVLCEGECMDEREGKTDEGGLNGTEKFENNFLTRTCVCVIV